MSTENNITTAWVQDRIWHDEIKESACWEKKAQLLAGRENDPGRVELRRQDLSRIFDGHPGEGGDGGGELRALGGPSILAADETYYDAQAHDNSDHHSENEAHRESVKSVRLVGLCWV